MSNPDPMITAKTTLGRTLASRDTARYVFKYLTPHKVFLLILIHAYCTASVSTKYHVAIFTLLLQHVEGPTEQYSSLDYLRERLSTLPSMLQNKSIYDVFLEMMWSLNSFDDFHSFIMSTSDYLTTRLSSPVPAKIKRPLLISSTLGRFVRKCRLEYINLDFDASATLWTLFKSSRAPSMKNLGHVNTQSLEEGGDGMFAFYVPLETPNAPNISCTSHDDIDKLCEFEIELLEKYGDRPSEAEHAKRIDLISSLSSTPVSFHFIRFKEAIHSGDYFSAVGHIHSYFDHSITMGGHQQETPKTYQFALFYLAILHEQFHNYSDAAWSVREAINTARENKDDISLLFSIAWLHQFSKKASVRDMKEIAMSREESLQYLKMKTKEANLPGLLGIVNLLEAQQLARSGGSLVSIFENVLKSSHVNLVFNLATRVGPQMTFQSSLWSRLGNQNLSSLYSEISLQHYSHDSLTEDVVRARCMKAHQSFKEGRTHECFNIFDAITAVSAQEFHVRNMLDFHRTVIELQLAVNQKQLGGATLKLQKLKALQYYDTDSAMHTLLGEVEVSMLRGDAEEALTLVQRKFQKVNEAEGDIGERLYLMILHGRLLLKVGKPSKALSMLIRCLDLAEKYNTRLIYLGAVSLLARVMNEFEQYNEAYRILSSVMPYILETKDCHLEATTYLTLAESLLSMSNTGDKPNLLRSQEFLDNARNGFHSIHDVDGESSCLLKLAFVLDKLGNTQARDIAARVYCELANSI